MHAARIATTSAWAVGSLLLVTRLLPRPTISPSFANLVSTTVYASNLDAIASQLAIFAEAFEGHPPTMTLIEVKALASPDYMLELVAVAAR